MKHYLRSCPTPCASARETTEGDGRRIIYVASSWRNQFHAGVVEALRAQGHWVYDFKQPSNTTECGFHRTDVSLVHSNSVDGDPWTGGLASATDYIAALSDPAAIHGFQRDFAAMSAADTFVLVLPCGRSAHLELGWAVGAGKDTAILLDDPCTPELMYRMVNKVTTSFADLVEWLGTSDSAPYLEEASSVDALTSQLPVAGMSISDAGGQQ